MTLTIPPDKKVILFDGVCNLCNSSVNKVIKWDKKNVFLFASLQSEFGKDLTQKLSLDSQALDSIILYEPSVAYYVKSTAILKITETLGGFWRLMTLFYFVPTGFRNLIYDYVAKNRYKWYGKKESCMLPSPELKAKFLD